MMTRPMTAAYNPDLWIGRSGKAAWYPTVYVFRVSGGQVPAGALAPGVFQAGGAQQLSMLRPRLMMDPSDPSTWQRQYRFTGGTLG